MLSEGSVDIEYLYGKEQEEYDKMMAENMDFSDEEDAEEMGGTTIKNAS